MYGANQGHRIINYIYNKNKPNIKPTTHLQEQISKMKTIGKK